MKRIQKTDTRSQATAYRWPAVLMGVPFLLLGGYFALAGFGFAPLPGKANAPLWVIGYVGLAFFLAGAMIFTFGVRGVLNQKRVRENRHRMEPWKLDYPWSSRGIRDKAAGRVLSSFSGLAFMAIFLVPFNWWAFMSSSGGLFVRVITGIFDLALLLVATTALYRLAQFLRYGHSYLSFRHFPYRPGEPLRVGFSGPSLDRLRATLRYVEERWETSGHGKNRSTRLVSYEHFSREREIASPGGAPEVEIEFELPENEEWVTGLSELPVRYWELVVESEQSGPDFRTTFPLPVYPRH